MASAIMTLQNQLHSAQKNQLFLQQQHIITLKGLQAEIHRVKKRCTDLTDGLNMRSPDPPSVSAMASANRTLELHLHSAQENLLALQQQHTSTLKGVHAKMRRLQQHCTASAMASAIMTVENLLHSAQENLLVLQQQHASTLKGVHAEMSRLQQWCTDLSYELIMRCSNPSSGPSTSAATAPGPRAAEPPTRKRLDSQEEVVKIQTRTPKK